MLGDAIDPALAPPDVVPFVEEDVLGLDVAVDDLVAVRVVECVGNLTSDACGRLHGDAPFGVHQRPQGLPFHHGHRGRAAGRGQGTRRPFRRRRVGGGW